MCKDVTKEINKTQRGKDQSWFGLGGRHALPNRVSDFESWIRECSHIESVVDIGAAEGQITEWLSSQVNNVHAIEHFDSLYNKLKLLKSERISTQQANILDGPLDKMYDIVFLLGVLHYFEEVQQRTFVIEHCLQHSMHAFVTRTAITEFKLQKANYKPVPNHVSLKELREFESDSIKVYVLDNNYRSAENRLGDLIVMYRLVPNNPLPPPSEFIDNLIPLNEISIRSL